MTLAVDGEIFEVTPTPTGGFSYGWTTGPNQGYGFARSRRFVAGDDPEAVAAANARELASPTPVSVDEHTRSIWDFLESINPETGYLD